MEESHKTYRALQLGTDDPDLITTFENFALESRAPKTEPSSDDDDEEMEIDSKQEESFKDRVLKVLRELDFLDKRPAKMAQAEFMLLLARFNAAEIHFVT